MKNHSSYLINTFINTLSLSLAWPYLLHTAVHQFPTINSNCRKPMRRAKIKETRAVYVLPPHPTRWWDVVLEERIKTFSYQTKHLTPSTRNESTRLFAKPVATAPAPAAASPSPVKYCCYLTLLLLLPKSQLPLSLYVVASLVVVDDGTMLVSDERRHDEWWWWWWHDEWKKCRNF